MVADRPHVVVVNDAAHVTGGAGMVALASAVGLAQAGHAVTVFTAHGPIMEELLLYPNLQVVCLGQHDILQHPDRIAASIQGLWNHPAASAMKQVLSNLAPTNTVVHAHTWTKALSSSVLRMARDRGFKIVITLHDYFVACPNGGFFIYPGNRLCTLPPLSVRCAMVQCDSRNHWHKLWRTLRQVLQAHLGGIPARVRHFITVSDFSAQVLRPYLPSAASLWRIDNPVRVAARAPVPVQNNKTFVALGRLGPEKGLQLFAEASKRSGLQAMIVGDGPLRQVLQESCPGTQITGWLEHDQAMQQLDHARVLVFPSLCYETHGLAVLEAAARGVPAIVSDSSAACDLIEHGVTGISFKSGDQADLARKMKVLCDDETVVAMGKAAYQRFWSHPPTLAGHIKALQDLYTKMLAES
jgi:glycosyltransferase involved in cell wall biosynthesis